MTLFVQTEVVQHEEDGRAEAIEEGRESEERRGADDGANVGMQTCLSGVADEGELFPEIVEEMELESLETEDLGDEDSSDEENAPSCTPLPIPAEWTNVNSEILVVDDRQNAPWEFHDNVVSQGAIYASKDVVKDAVKRWSLSIRRSFIVHRATTKLYEVSCPRSGCPFRVHATEGKWTKQWKCSIVVDHTCELHELEVGHKNLTSVFIANHMYGAIIDNIHYEPKSIIRQIQEDFQYTITYGKAWRAK